MGSVTKVEDKKVREFLEKVEELYRFVEEFCKRQNLGYRYNDIEIYEEFGGRYRTKELYVYENGEFLFKLKPVGAYIIAADGRVDLIGKFDEVRLIFLAKSYEIQRELKVNGEVIEKISKPLYKGFEKEGWYVSLKNGKVKPLKEEVLCQILEEVSEFKCSEGNKKEV